MKLAMKFLYFVFLTLVLFSLSACRAGSGNTFTGGGGGGGNNTGGGGNGGGTGGGGASGGPFTIGGTVVGLAGSGLVLEDNGSDDLSITGTGTVSFTFKNAVTGTYAVIVKAQPSTPTQTCGVSNGTGTATATVTNIQVVCAPIFFVGGSITGLLGSGLTLQDNGGDNLTIGGNGNVNFTFPTPLISGANYAVTVLTQPKAPVQTCSVFNGSGIIAGSVTNIDISCSQPAYSISGSVVGLIEGNGTGDTMELQDNAGDNLFVTGDTSFTFPTPVTQGGIYNVWVFLPPNSQRQPCNLFHYTGIATSNVSDVLIDCEHNDWNWISNFIPASSASNNYATVTTPRFPAGQVPPADVSLPGGRNFPMSWTDNKGRKWLFGGDGFPYPSPLGKQLPGFLNDLWVYDTTALVPAWVPANLPTIFPVSAPPIVDPTPLESVFSSGSYGSLGVASASNSPQARWGGSTWTDSAGNLWMFGGQGFGLLNDIWEWQPGAPDTNGAGTFTGQWIWQGGSNTGNQSGTYGPQNTPGGFPGGRWAAATATDPSGANVYLFGGQGVDSTGAVGLLNDLWKYTIASGQWTWIGPANSTTAGQKGFYGMLGLPSASNYPGGRQGATLWVDSSGTIWLFGGFGIDSVFTGQPNGSTLNDLWKFSGGQWTWVSGGGATGVGDQNGVYGTQGTSDHSTGVAGNVPGSRWGSVGWLNPDGDLFLFGGWGYGTSATLPTGFLNDIWEYDHLSGKWLWWKGAPGVNQSSAFMDTHQLPYVKNVVGGRRGMAMWPPDSNGDVWIFGGEGYDGTAGNPPGYLDDLWTFLPFP